MKSISVSWSSEVQDEEAVQCLASIVGVITSVYYTRWPWGLISPIVGLRPFGNWVIPALPEGSPYSSFDWYVETARDEGQAAIDADRFLELVVNEPWQQESGHYDFSLVHGPLRGSQSPEPLPLAVHPGVAVVISADWVRSLEAVEMRQQVLQRLSFHGIGRAFGLRAHPSDGPLCAMRTFAGSTDLLAKTMEEQAGSTIYCDEHVRELLGTLLAGRNPMN